MRKIELTLECPIVQTPRTMQLSGMFDVPASEKLSHHWKGEIPIDERPWHVGLIVGPSGAGKSSVMRQLFGEHAIPEWKTGAVVDDFASAFSIQEITDVCSAVGFNSIPSWMKPYAVLSTGEKFRVELARALLEREDPVVIDEFTSVVDRQVAKIGAHAAQRYVRKNKRQFVAVTCHYDVEEWLQPDWIFEPATMSFTWRELRQRPPLAIEIARVEYEAWRVFAPFHYLTAELNPSAACFALFVDGSIAAFAGVLHRPHALVHDIKGVSRLVTLPDYQGFGLAFVLVDTLGSAYRALGYRLRTYPAHPSLVRAFWRSPAWRQEKKAGTFSAKYGSSSSVGSFGGRPCATYEFVGETMRDVAVARSLIG